MTLMTNGGQIEKKEETTLEKKLYFSISHHDNVCPSFIFTFILIIVFIILFILIVITFIAVCTNEPAQHGLGRMLLLRGNKSMLSPEVDCENSRHFATASLVSTRNDTCGKRAEIPHWWRVATKIWVVLLIGWKFDSSTDQKHYPDLATEGLSNWVWNFCARSSGVISRGKPAEASRNVCCFLKSPDFPFPFPGFRTPGLSRRQVRDAPK